MWDLFRLIFGLIIDLFRSRAALQAEVLVLKQQIIVLRRGKPNRMSFLAVDRFILGWVCRLFSKAHDALAIVRPDTVVRWHRAGLRLFWRWKSRRRLGRPAVPTEIRQLIREMSKSALEIFGLPDDLKFRSCITLFYEAASDESDCLLFAEALQQFYNGEADPRTLELLRLTLFGLFSARPSRD
jgi:hypothetical protein